MTDELEDTIGDAIVLRLQQLGGSWSTRVERTTIHELKLSHPHGKLEGHIIAEHDAEGPTGRYLWTAWAEFVGTGSSRASVDYETAVARCTRALYFLELAQLVVAEDGDIPGPWLAAVSKGKVPLVGR